MVSAVNCSTTIQFELVDSNCKRPCLQILMKAHADGFDADSL